VANAPVKLADDPAEDEQVTDLVAARCPSCASAVRPGAQWCTLCFTDLRTREEPPVQPDAPVAPAAAVDRAPAARARHRAPKPSDQEPAALDPLTAPLALLERTDPPIPAPKHAAPTPDGDGAPDEAAQTEQTGGEQSDAFWPCLKCGESVGIELSHCPVCGGGFMESGFAVDGAGGLDRLGSGAPDRQLKLRIMIGGAGLLTIAIVALLFIIGLLF
jgi:hypothetical protein